MSTINVFFLKSSDALLNNETEACINRQIVSEKTQINLLEVDLQYDNTVPYAAELFLPFKDRIKKGIVTFIEGGDLFSDHYFQHAVDAVHSVKSQVKGFTAFAKAKMADKASGELTQFCNKNYFNEYQYVDFSISVDTVPYRLPGTWIDSQYFLKAVAADTWTGEEFETAFLVCAAADLMQMVLVTNEEYSLNRITDEDLALFYGYYQESWYTDRLFGLWKPLLEKMASSENGIPKIVQYQALYAIISRALANIDNKNKHVIPAEKAEEYMLQWKDILRYIDDDVIFNNQDVKYCYFDPRLRRVLMRIKYEDMGLDYEVFFDKSNIYWGKDNYLLKSLKTNGVNIQALEYEDRTLHIDGILPALYDIENGRFYIKTNKHDYPVTFTGRYAHTKLFGTSVYKNYPFEADVPVTSDEKQWIWFVYCLGDETITLPLEFDSHFSRLSKKFRNNYWTFGKNREYLAFYRNTGLYIRKAGKKFRIKQELLLWREMLRQRKERKRNLKFFLLRLAYFVLGPIMTKKPIWLYMDKIYKGGDSAEYLCRYASAQKDGRKHIYLIDKNAAEYKALKRDHINVAVRGSMKHRLAFLLADMLICTNSTIFAFNDYNMSKSGYIRDLVHFKVVCVQHGMSIQKIAIAQNRMRDHTDLYFCASKYEIENLNHPVYDYAGRDILKLTGVPRHDGLVNEDKKQILISPTWRMQAAMPVTKNEGVARDYNENFKSTAYYKEYNSLINNRRLLDAAREYGYRILYVLHPIVSPQIGDFDRNDQVEIVASIGDFSYEKAFRESSLMITDYSGIQFDFAYMRKPVLYYHNAEAEAHYEEGSFIYATMGFGEICTDEESLVDTCIEYMKNNCVMKPEYVRRADDFFEFSDHKNCERIYQVMDAYCRG